MKTSAALTALLLLCVLLPSARAASPSFGCTGNLAPTEKTICADDSLAALDVAMAQAYKAKLASLPSDSGNSLDETRVGLTFTQKAWIAHRNSCGTDKACIAKAYRLRTGELTAGPNTPDVACSDTIGAAAANLLVKQCQQVATATHPPCNAANSCELIVSHNANRCGSLGNAAPKFCADYPHP
jgi:uncharacterized protein